MHPAGKSKLLLKAFCALPGFFFGMGLLATPSPSPLGAVPEFFGSY